MSERISIEQCVGRIEGQVTGINQRIDGIGRELGEIKNILKCKDADCEACRAEIDGRISTTTGAITKDLANAQGEIAEIQRVHSGDERVRSWKDSTFLKAAELLGIGLSLIGVIYLILQGG